MKKDATLAAGSSIHVHLPNNILTTSLNRSFPAAGLGAAVATATVTPVKLLSQLYPGQEMTVAGFCQEFDLSENIHN